MINRLAIFIFYDKQGIVDDYIPYFLDRLKPFLKDLVIIVNGKLTAIGQKKIKSLTKNLFIRENIGYEPGAIKEVLFKLYGFEKILQYDELLICNDTFYGPFFDLKEVFSKMDKTECDFWGITEQAAKKGSYPKHIQSYFYNIKKKLLHNKHFKNFFGSLPLPKNLTQAIKSYEIAMSQFFLNKGFSYASFIPVNYFIESDIRKNFNYSLVSPINLLKNGCPFIKKKAFFYNDENKEIPIEGGEQSNGLMQFIENNTEYPQKIIWQNLLKVANITEIKNKLHLQYVLPKNTLISNSKKLENKKIAVIVHLYNIDLLNECLIYLDNISTFIDLIVKTTKIEIAEKLRKYFDKRRKYDIQLIENIGRDITDLLVNCKDILQKYDYFCFIYDKNEKLTRIEVNSFRFLLWECTLASKYYIKNILNKFENEPELGFLSVPQPFHGKYFEIFKEEWPRDTHAFWCRTKALIHLPNFKILERLLPYIAQSKGYYSGICLTDSYAQIRINCLENIIIKKERKNKGNRRKNTFIC